jgi:hypothetical protein
MVIYISTVAKEKDIANIHSWFIGGWPVIG